MTKQVLIVILVSIFFAGLLLRYRLRPHSWLGRIAFVLAGVVFLLLGFGVIKGFSPIVLADGIAINTAKAAAALITIAIMGPRWAFNRKAAIATAACLVIVPLLGLLSGFVGFNQPTIDTVLWFAVANIFSTLAEELFFRLWIQRSLLRFGATASIMVTAMLFGAVHFAGGLTFAILAGVAGLFYAYVYHVSKSVYAAALTHWFTNIVRVLLFGLP